MSKAEIIAELVHLSPEDLADVRDWIDRLTFEKTSPRPTAAGSTIPRIRSPRLANPALAPDFVKQVTELPANAAL